MISFECLEIENQALRESIRELEASTQWRPIDTAPRDGTRVLLWVPPYGPSTGHYEPARVNWGPNASLWIAASVLNKEAHPTHWMPLPSPPKQDGV